MAIVDSTRATLERLIGGIPDPEIGLSLAELGMVGHIELDSHTVRIEILLTTPGCPLRHQLRMAVQTALHEAGLHDHELDLRFGELDAAAKRRAMARARQHAQDLAPVVPELAGTQVVALASGKGGVGKSTLSAALASAIATRGYRVGLLDADIWGFSQTHLTGTAGKRLEAEGDRSHWRIVPVERPHGAGRVAMVSMGMLVEEAGEAIMWRGLLLARALQHFVEDVAWGQPDYLVVDLPPGTGDVPMALARLLPATKVLIVTTPSELAARVAERALSFAVKANLQVLGVVENMSTLTCPHGEELRPFGAGGGELIAERSSLPLLATLPIEHLDAESPSIVELTSTLLEHLARLAASEQDCSARLWQALEAPARAADSALR